MWPTWSSRRWMERQLKLDLHLPAGIEDPPLVVFHSWRRLEKGQPQILQSGMADRARFCRGEHQLPVHGRGDLPRPNSRLQGRHPLAPRQRRERTVTMPGKIGVCGTSAGGHLSLLLGTSGGVDALEGEVGGNLDQSSRVNAVVNFYGPSDFVLRSKTQPAKTEETTGSAYLLSGRKSLRPIGESQTRLGCVARFTRRSSPPEHSRKERTRPSSSTRPSASSAAYEKARFTHRIDRRRGGSPWRARNSSPERTASGLWRSFSVTSGRAERRRRGEASAEEAPHSDALSDRVILPCSTWNLPDPRSKAKEIPGAASRSRLRSRMGYPGRALPASPLGIPPQNTLYVPRFRPRASIISLGTKQASTLSAQGSPSSLPCQSN